MTRVLAVAGLLILMGPLLGGSILRQGLPGGLTLDLAFTGAVAAAATLGTPLGTAAGFLAGIVMDATAGGGRALIPGYAVAALVAGACADRGKGADVVSAFICALLAALTWVVCTSLTLRWHGMITPMDGPHAILWIGYESASVLIARRLMARPRVPFLGFGTQEARSRAV